MNVYVDECVDVLISSFSANRVHSPGFYLATGIRCSLISLCAVSEMPRDRDA